MTADARALVSVTVESWRFARLFARVLGKLDAGEQARFHGQFRWYLNRLREELDAAGLKLVDLEGQRFDPGAAASPLNAGDFAPDDLLVVDQMVEPTIVGPGGVVHAGTVLLRKVEQ
jgi:hypothetical protein